MEPDAPSHIDGDGYVVSAADAAAFRANGFVRLRGVLTEAEMAAVIDPVYHAFMRREVAVPGRDLCDMAGGPPGAAPEEFKVYNVMLPRIYRPDWQGNVLERRCKAIADQLRGGGDGDMDFEIDFDQIFAKRASAPDSAFDWHQDAAYWPPLKSDTAAVNCWLAVSDVTKESGCLRYVPGSHLEPQLRRHRPVGATRAESHALRTDVDEAREAVVDVPCARGDVIVHHEAVVHASWPNTSPHWRHAYILNFRKRACIAEERALGFTHSHNDEVNWDVFARWQGGGGPAG
ncbi:phyhd1 [Scenedesmus sp. PABB004]|nr:phyhd1 [Scenedesmus sp. PABB004]